MPKVSVIVPVYNTEEYIEKCLNSLVNQTLQDIEIIVVNDGTPDNSQKIIDVFVNKYPKKVKSIIKENGGLGSARNAGMKIATSEYIGFVDSDDYVELTMYEKLYEKAIENNCDIVECNFKWIYPFKEVNDIANYYNGNDINTNIRVISWNKIYRKSIIDENKISFPDRLRYEDIEFIYKLLPFVKKIDHIEDFMYMYIQREGSIINTQNAKVREIFEILSNVENFYKENNIFGENKELIEYININFLLGSSFLRVIKVEDKKLRKSILYETWEILNSKYPEWKNNKILKSKKGLKFIYYRLLNKLFFILSSKLFRSIKR